MTEIPVWIKASLISFGAERPGLTMLTKEPTDPSAYQLAFTALPGLYTPSWQGNEPTTYGADPADYGLPTLYSPQAEKPDYIGFANAIRPVANDIILNSFATTFSRALLTSIVNVYAWAKAPRFFPDEDEAARGRKELRLLQAAGIELPDDLEWGSRSVVRNKAFTNALSKLKLSAPEPVEGVEDLYTATLTVEDTEVTND